MKCSPGSHGNSSANSTFLVAGSPQPCQPHVCSVAMLALALKVALRQPGGDFRVVEVLLAQPYGVPGVLVADHLVEVPGLPGRWGSAVVPAAEVQEGEV